MPSKGEVANHRIVVTEETFVALFNLRKPGQTFGDLVTELVEMKQHQNLITDMDEASAGEFIPLKEAEAQIRAGASQ